MGIWSTRDSPDNQTSNSVLLARCSTRVGLDSLASDSVLLVRWAILLPEMVLIAWIKLSLVSRVSSFTTRVGPDRLTSNSVLLARWASSQPQLVLNLIVSHWVNKGVVHMSVEQSGRGLSMKELGGTILAVINQSDTSSFSMLWQSPTAHKE